MSSHIMGPPHNITQEIEIIFLATELWFKARQIGEFEIQKPFDWLYNPNEHYANWKDKKRQLIDCNNYDKDSPLVQYCEVMSKYVEQHKLVKSQSTTSL